MMLYSAGTKGFYSEDINDIIPDDAVEITSEKWMELLQGQRNGKIISSDASGYPVLTDPLPLTEQQLKDIASGKKIALLAEASSVIAPLRDALDGGYIDDADKPKLIAWQKYRYE
ncbi:tail fiber assembly protein, partial [Salmonella enterica subsp. enterica serovar Montevideo]